jgi:hypothetical protein
MTKKFSSQTSLSVQDRFGLRLAARLSESADTLPHDITERLRVARVQALAQLKRVQAASVVSNGGGTATLGFGGERVNLWQRIASILPLLALVAGLIGVRMLDNDSRAKEMAEIDSAILTDDLPPTAYADPGFMQFLNINTSRDQTQ